MQAKQATISKTRNRKANIGRTDTYAVTHSLVLHVGRLHVVLNGELFVGLLHVGLHLHHHQRSAHNANLKTRAADRRPHVLQQTMRDSNHAHGELAEDTLLQQLAIT